MRRAALFVLLPLLAAFALACDDDASSVTPPPPPVNLPGLIDPVWEYSHSVGNSVTGGYVLRATGLTALEGKYIYADYGTGRIWALTYDGMGPASNELVFDAPFPISSFGVGANDQLYIARYGTNVNLYRITGTYDIVNNTWDYGVGPIYPGTFTNPVDIRNAGDTRLFVVEQAGYIRVFDTANAQAPTTFLDIHNDISSGGERGLLGLAFHPDYASNGLFFVYYTSPTGSVVISRFQVSGNPDVADPGSEATLLEIPQQYSNHNGGGLAFDGTGRLLVAVGDEGSSGDPNDNAQDRTTLHGSILRLDVDTDTPPYYTIPPDNPFAGSATYRQEIFAWGLRNPWRISYDADTDRIWVGDVGQNLWEEIDVIVSGGNYGWDCREGTHDFTGEGAVDGPSPVCAGAGP